MSSSIFTHTIAAYIKSQHLLNKESKYLVALSGGADSVALLSVLNELGYVIEAIHCNFHLRGKESDRDEAFCKMLCNKKKIPLHLASFDTTSFAKIHHISIEMAARQLRYHYFAQLCSDITANGICVGHHADDQVETVLLNLIRGTGIDGLTGMKPRNGIVIRPLLAVNRKQIIAYLQSLGQDYVTDSTNLVDDIQRNKIRLDVLPLLEKVNPAVKSNILHMAENLSEVQLAIGAQLDEAKRNAMEVGDLQSSQSDTDFESKQLTFNISRLQAYSSPKLLFWHILSTYGFNRSQVAEIISSHMLSTEELAKHGSRLWLAKAFVALSDGRQLRIIDRKEWECPFPVLKMPECGLYRMNNLACRVEAFSFEKQFQVSRFKYKITIDSDKIVFPLILRRTAPGDKFMPYGLHGHKLVSDFLKDSHLDPVTRKHQLVLTDATGNILWVVGSRIDDHYKIIQEKTKNILQIELTKGNLA